MPLRLAGAGVASGDSRDSRHSAPSHDGPRIYHIADQMGQLLISLLCKTCAKYDEYLLIMNQQINQEKEGTLLRFILGIF